MNIINENKFIALSIAKSIDNQFENHFDDNESIMNSLVRYIRENTSSLQQRSTHVQVMDGEEFIPLPQFEEQIGEAEKTIEAENQIEADLTTSSDEEEAEAEEETEAEEEAEAEEETEAAENQIEADLSTSSDEEECHRIICCRETSTNPECSICLDAIQTNANSSTTRCGHSFHTSCFLKAIQCGSGNCPNCRALLVIKDSDNEEDESEYESDDDYEYESAYEDDSESILSVAVTLEQVANKLENMGYSTADILSLYLGKTVGSNTDEKYSIEFFLKINEDLDKILDGTIPLNQRDNRSFRDVVMSSNA